MSMRQLTRLFIRTCIFIALAVLLTGTIRAFAAVSAHDPLFKHISRYCKTNCVDPDLLRMAVSVSYQETRIDPLLLTAIIHVESKFVIKALNKTNGRSVGLTQVQVKWHPEKWVTDNHYDVFDNIRVGAMIYRDCAEKHRNNRKKALWCYNGHQKRGMSTYAPKVLKIYQELKSQGIKI